MDMESVEMLNIDAKRTKEITKRPTIPNYMILIRLRLISNKIFDPLYSKYMILLKGIRIKLFSTLSRAREEDHFRTVIAAGKACSWYHNHVSRNLTCNRVQVDEIWNFIYAKRRHGLPAVVTATPQSSSWTTLRLGLPSASNLLDGRTG